MFYERNALCWDQTADEDLKKGRMDKWKQSRPGLLSAKGKFPILVATSLSRDFES